MTDTPLSPTKSIAVFFSHGTTLEVWERGGLLDREVGYYRSLLDHMNSVTFVTYDLPSVDSNRLNNSIAPIEVLNNKLRVNYRLFGLLAPFVHYKALNQCSLIKTNQLRGAWTGLIAKWILRKPLVVRCGYVWSRNAIREGATGLKKQMILKIEGFVARQADMNIVATEDDLRYIMQTHRVPEEKLFVLSNPIDMELFSPQPEVSKIPGLITYVGRLAPEKNLGLLIGAVKRVPEARLMLIGSGIEEPALRLLAGNSGQVEFKGSVPNKEIPNLLNMSEVFVLPSNYEGSPKALLEAMACGLPVIGTDVPGIRNVIQHDENGLLCQREEEDLANAIQRLLSDASLRERLGQQARFTVLERHSQEGIALREASLIEKLLARAAV